MIVVVVSPRWYTCDVVVTVRVTLQLVVMIAIAKYAAIIAIAPHIPYFFISSFNFSINKYSDPYDHLKRFYKFGICFAEILRRP